MPPRCPRGRTSRLAARMAAVHSRMSSQTIRTSVLRDVEAVGVEGAVTGVGALLRLGPADRQDRLVGLAREQVPPAGAAAGQQPPAARVAALDLGAVGGRRAGHEPPALLLHPAEGRDVVVRAEQDARLAGAGLRGEVGLPLDQAVGVLGEPARHLRGAAVAHRPAQDGEGEAVDLQEDDAGHRGAGRARGPGRDALDDPEVVGVVVVGAEDDLQHHADGGRDAAP